MRKLTNRKLDKGTPVKEIAVVMRVTPRRIYQLKKQYRKTGEIPELKQETQTDKLRRGKIVLEAYQKYKLSPVPLEKTDRKRLRHLHSTQHYLQ